VAAGLAALTGTDRPVNAAEDSVAQGKAIFRFDTFGDEQLWTKVLKMHNVIEASVDPLTALGVGLKVDVDGLPRPCGRGVIAG
jgi:hypothetical protein